MTSESSSLKPPKPTSIPVHGNSVITVLLVDPDQNRIITASDDCTILVLKETEGRWSVQHELKGHEGGVWCLSLLPTKADRDSDVYGDLLVSGSTDRSVRIWDLKEEKCVSVFEGHKSTVRCIGLTNVQEGTSEGEGGEEKVLIVSGSRDNNLSVWRLPKFGEGEKGYVTASAEGEDGEKALRENPYHERILAGHEHAIRDLSVQGKTAVSGSYDMTIRVWDILTGECKFVLEGHTSGVYTVLLDPTRPQAYSTSMDHTVRVWDLTNGTCKHVLEGHLSLVGLIKLSPNGQNLVSGCADGTCRVWDPDSGELRQVLVDENLRLQHGELPAIICFHVNNEKVVTGSDSGLYIWDLSTGKFTKGAVKGNGIWQVRQLGGMSVVGVTKADGTYLDIF